MLYIRHRINTVDALRDVPADQGVELDIRARGGRLILQHEAFEDGVPFEDLLRVYRHAFMIVNIKDEGTEQAARDLLRHYGVESYFFLDLSFPAMVRFMKAGESGMAVRFSEFEPAEQALALAGKVRWVWIDCFTTLPLDARVYGILKRHFKLCLVSPELQGHPKERIAEFKEIIGKMEVDAVCTKYPHLWSQKG